MLKKIFLTFLILNLFTVCFAQIKVPFELVGQTKGKIKMISHQQKPFVAARTFGRTLGMRSSWFGASGRLELTKDGKTAELTNKQNFALINKQKKDLSAEPFIQDDILYVPLDFFNEISDYDISFTDNKLIAERRYSLALKEQKNNSNSYQLVFYTKGELPFRIEKSTKDKAEIFLPGAIVKRDEILSPKNNFFHRIRISQKAKGVQIAILFKKNTPNWEFYYNGKDFIFEVSSGKIQKNILEGEEETTESTEEQIALRPSVLMEPQDKTEDFKDAIELGDDFFNTSVAEVSTPAKKTNSPAKVEPLPIPTILPTTIQNKGKLKVLIDPGHGGKDPGATRKGSAREKELNLKVAKQLYALLSKEKNVEVKMTRDDDTFISLGDRARMSSKYDSDIFVSIHTNAAKRSSASGFEVYFRSDKASDAEAAQTAALENEALQYEGKTSAGLSFADLLLQSLATNENINKSSKLAAHIRLLTSKEADKTGIKVFNNSAIKQANFYVLRGVKCPAVLVEMGYISNASDRKRLNNKNTQNLLAKTIAKGILTYAKEEGWK